MEGDEPKKKTRAKRRITLKERAPVNGGDESEDAATERKKPVLSLHVKKTLEKQSRETRDRKLHAKAERRRRRERKEKEKEELGIPRKKPRNVAPSRRFPLALNTAKKKDYKRKSDYKRAIAALENFKEREMLNASAKCFKIDGNNINRYAMMEVIIQMVYDGASLPKVLKDLCDGDGNIVPTPFEVTGWFDRHPDFKRELDKAEKYRAELLVSDAMDEVMKLNEEDSEYNKDTIAKAKLVKDTLTEQAAFLNDKFQTKTKQQIEDVTEKLSIDQVKERIRAFLEANPEYAELANKQTKELGMECEVITDEQGSC